MTARNLKPIYPRHKRNGGGGGGDGGGGGGDNWGNNNNNGGGGIGAGYGAYGNENSSYSNWGNNMDNNWGNNMGNNWGNNSSRGGGDGRSGGSGGHDTFKRLRRDENYKYKNNSYKKFGENESAGCRQGMDYIKKFFNKVEKMYNNIQEPAPYMDSIHF
jgi:hypothetical protein